MQSVLGRSALREQIKSAGWSTRPGTGDCSGDSEKVNGMTCDIAMVKKAQPSGERRLRVRFAGDRREYVLDLTGLIARSRHFAQLMEDADTFAKIDIVDDGLGVAWPVETKWGHLDLSGSTLRRMAEEQLPMSGADFAKWRKSLGLSLTEAAKLLGVGRRTIMGWSNLP